MEICKKKNTKVNSTFCKFGCELSEDCETYQKLKNVKTF